MAMGIFDQLAWLTTRVKRLCCAIKVGAYQERTIDATPLEGASDYPITEGGIYQFYGGTGTAFAASTSAPTSVGQTMYIINASVDSIVVTGPAYNGTSGTTMQAYGSILAGEIWQFISVQGTPVFDTGLVWVGVKLYPNAI
jgi:hypothetical protein